MRELINLLLVDDNSDFLEMIRDMLIEENITVKSVETVAGAEKVMHEFEIDAVVCDYNLPDSNGLDFLRLIRKTGLHTPFILISGNITPEILSNSLRLGAFDVIEKPLRFDQLCQKISEAVNSGIQYRLLQERIKNKLAPEDLKLVTNSLKIISMLRSSNFDKAQKKSTNEAA